MLNSAAPVAKIAHAAARTPFRLRSTTRLVDASVPQTIAIGIYDFRASGAVAKCIEIAAALAFAGLPVELWAVRARGPFLPRVPKEVPVIEVARGGLSAGNRAVDLTLAMNALRGCLRRRRPAVFVSGANHLHLIANMAMRLSGLRREIRFGIRASNSSRRRGDEARPKARKLGALKYAGADFIVAVSRDLAKEIRASNPRAAIECVPNGVDIARVRRIIDEPFDHPFLSARAADGAPVIVSVGRLCHQKGFDLLIRALALLDRPARLMIVGDGPEPALRKLRRLAEELGVADRVAFTGYQANPFSIVAKADLFANASRWEGSSNALIEALVCGVPVVATDCPTGNREALGDGAHGLLVPPEDAAALARGIAAALAGGVERAELSAISRLDLEICLGQWVEILSRKATIAT